MIEKTTLLQTHFEHCSLETDLESAILEYAITRFPYMEALQYFYEVEGCAFRQLLEAYISEGRVKIGFYYETMQEKLVLFYFLRVGEWEYIILGLNSGQTHIRIAPEVNNVFRLEEEQYIDFLQIPMN